MSSQPCLNVIDRSTWYLSPLELVSSVSNASSYTNDLLVDDNDNIHCVWKDFANYDGAGVEADIFYRKWSKTTSTWSTTEVISVNSNDYSDNADIAVDQLGNVHVVWDDAHEYLTSGSDLDVFYRKWDAVSSTWSSVELVSSESSAHSYAPSLEVDSSNNLHVAWIDMSDILSAGADRDIFYKCKFYANNSWSTPTVVSTSGSGESYYPDMFIDISDDVHIVWHDDSDILATGTDNDVFYRKLDTSSENWLPITPISRDSDSSSALPKIVGDDNGNLFIVWYDFSDYLGAGTDADVFMSKWVPFLGLWTETMVVSEGTDFHSYNPSFDVDIFGAVHLAWYQAGGFGGSGYDRDIYYKTWDFDSDIWSDLNLISRESTDDSWTTMLATNSEGHVIFCWYDTTDNLLPGSGTDADLFLRKFVGAPEAPILSSIIPNPSSPGNISLNWDEVIGADEYKIYNSSSDIIDLSGLTPLATITTNSYVDSIDIPGTYYYAIVSVNEWGDSVLSNVESIEILSPEVSPGFFESLRIGEILALAGIIGGFQIILTTVIVLILRTTPPKKTSSRKKK